MKTYSSEDDHIHLLSGQVAVSAAVIIAGEYSIRRKRGETGNDPFTRVNADLEGKKTN